MKKIMALMIGVIIGFSTVALGQSGDQYPIHRLWSGDGVVGKDERGLLIETERTPSAPISKELVELTGAEIECIPVGDRKQMTLRSLITGTTCYRFTTQEDCLCIPGADTEEACQTALVTGTSASVTTNRLYDVSKNWDSNTGDRLKLIDAVEKSHNTTSFATNTVVLASTTSPTKGNYNLVQAVEDFDTWTPAAVGDTFLLDPASGVDWTVDEWKTTPGTFLLKDSAEDTFTIDANLENSMTLALGTPAAGVYEIILPYDDVEGDLTSYTPGSASAGKVAVPVAMTGFCDDPNDLPDMTGWYLYDEDADAGYAVIGCEEDTLIHAGSVVTFGGDAFVYTVEFTGNAIGAGEEFVVAPQAQWAGGWCDDGAAATVEDWILQMATGRGYEVSGCRLNVVEFASPSLAASKHVIAGAVYAHTGSIVDEGAAAKITSGTSRIALPGEWHHVGETWTPEAFKDKWLFVGGQVYEIEDNAASSLTLEDSDAVPAEGVYQILEPDIEIECTDEDVFSMTSTASHPINTKSEWYLMALSDNTGNIEIIRGEGLTTTYHISGTVTGTVDVDTAVDDPIWCALTDGGESLVKSAAPESGDAGIVTRNIPSGTQTVDGTVTANQGTAALVTAPWSVRQSNGANWQTYYTSGTVAGTEAFSASFSEAYQHPADATATVRLRPSASQVAGAWGMPSFTTWTGTDYSSPEHVVTGGATSEHESASMSLAFEDATDADVSHRLKARTDAPAVDEPTVVIRGITYVLNADGDALVPIQHDATNRIAVTAHPTGTYTVDGTVAATQSGAWSSRTQDGAGTGITSRTDAGRQDLHVYDTASATSLSSIDTDTGNIATNTGNTTSAVLDLGCIPDLSANETCLSTCLADGSVTINLAAGRYEMSVHGETTWVKEGVNVLAAGGNRFVPGTQRVYDAAATVDWACRSGTGTGSVCFHACL